MQLRHEYKYLISTHTAAIVRSRISAFMTPDENGASYTVYNLYLDDVYDSYYLDKHRGNHVRDKYRLRYYNGNLDFIRLERKHKEGTLAYKDTMLISQEQYLKIKSGDLGFITELAVADGEKPTLLQNLGIIHRIKQLRPTAFYAYQREAFVYAPGNVRFTFDSPPFDPEGNSSTGINDFRVSVYGNPVYNLLLEIKYTGFMPEVIKRIMGGLPLAHTEMSKYSIVRERGILPYGTT